jgi:hypothetical protein
MKKLLISAVARMSSVMAVLVEASPAATTRRLKTSRIGTGRFLTIAFLALLVSVMVLGNSPVFAAITRWVDLLAASAAPGTGCGTNAAYNTIGAAITAAARVTRSWSVRAYTLNRSRSTRP